MKKLLSWWPVVALFMLVVTLLGGFIWNGALLMEYYGLLCK